MNCWEILGIEPTEDIVTIKKAFAAQSKLHHPEDDPDGFQLLRSAYRQALEIAEYRSHFPASDSLSSASSNKTLVYPNYQDEPSIKSTQSPEFELNKIATDAPYDYSSVEHFDKLIETSYKIGIDVQAKEFSKQARARQRRKHIKLATKLVQLLFAILLIIGSGFLVRYLNSGESLFSNNSLSFTQIDMLKAQARTIWNQEANYRLEILEQLKTGTSYSQSSAENLLITESEYAELLEDFWVQGEAAAAKRLETFRPDETSLVKDQFLPAIKDGIISNNLIQVLQLGTVVGMDYEQCYMLIALYAAYKDKDLLDTELMPYDHLVSPDQWDINFD